MRASSAVLIDTPIRLWDLTFPRDRVLLGRTRAVYVHLDNLIAFSKRDREGKVDAYLVAYLPDEVVLLFFLGGDLVNAATLTPVGRFPTAIGDAVRHAAREPERAELAFHAAAPDLLAAMYASCAQQPLDLPLDPSSPESVFRTLFERRWTGTLELISNGRVNYLAVRDGRFAAGHFADRRPDEPPLGYVSNLFTAPHPEPKPRVVAKAYPGLAALPVQAPPAMVAMFRRYVWDLSELAEREAPGEGLQRAERIRQHLSVRHEALRGLGGPRGNQAADPLVEPQVLADAVAAWTRDLLTELEVLQPQSAPRLLRDAAQEHRFALGAVGFFERLPWRVQW